MTVSPPPDTISEHFLAACRGELSALKPGNVHVFADGHRMVVAQFEAAALASAPHIANPELKVGERVLRAVKASFEASGCNTNLGICLLCAPLARAAEMVRGSQDLRESLAIVLTQLDVEDASKAFEAILLANPAGLGDAPKEDVHQAPSRTLREAMGMAADKDRIARAFVTDFEDVFEFGLPVLRDARTHCEAAKIDPSFAITTLHMSYLAQFPDSHIQRKHGEDAAMEVTQQALKLTDQWLPKANLDTFDALLGFDTSLKDRGLNPGTTADMVVATLFADSLDRSLA